MRENEISGYPPFSFNNGLYEKYKPNTQYEGKALHTEILNTALKVYKYGSPLKGRQAKGQLVISFQPMDESLGFAGYFTEGELVTLHQQCKAMLPEELRRKPIDAHLPRTSVSNERIADHRELNIDVRAAALVLEYMLDTKRLLVEDPREGLLSEAEELNSDELVSIVESGANKQRLLGEIQKYARRTMLGIVAEAGMSATLGGAVKKTILSNNRFDTDIVNRIGARLPVNLNDMGDFLHILANDLRLYARGASFGGTWGRLAYDPVGDEIFVRTVRKGVQTSDLPQITPSEQVIDEEFP